MESITITLNGTPAPVAAGTTLATFIASTGQAPEALATAVNGEFVAREARAQRVLNEADAIFTFQPITGG